MQSTQMNEAARVAAAQAGDRRALDELTAAYLPLVYTIVRRGLGAHPDVDDVVQDVMLRALRKLPELRTPATFRSWLAAIAIRQVGTHQRRADRATARTAELDEAAGLADTGSPSENLTALQVDLSRQRRQLERAGHWLDPGDRALLSLWWLEVAGQLSRADLAAAVGLSAAHAGVRVQRMHTQVEACRALVAALDQRPRCPRLAGIAGTWDGTPSPLWRKRLSRHVRSCPVCGRASGALVATERLFPAYALLPVPAGLGLSLLGKLTLDGAAGAAAGARAGLLGQLVQAAALHPIVSTVAAGALVAGAGVTTVQLTSPPPPAPRVTTAKPIALGRLSLESQNAPGRYVASVDSLGVLVTAGTTDAVAFTAVEGLADRRCYSFRYADGRFLRHASWRVRLNPDVGTELFRGDATFCARAGAVTGSVALESSNYPGWFLRHRGDELWVDQSDGGAAFLADGSFRVRPPLGN
jgi:RNA polymerase sigma factor (sigma-70 family)